MRELVNTFLIIFIVLGFIIVGLAYGDEEKQDKDLHPVQIKKTMDGLFQVAREDMNKAFELALDKLIEKQKRIVEQDKEIKRLNQLLLEKIEQLEKVENELAELQADTDKWYNIFKSTIGLGYNYQQEMSIFAQERITIFQPFWFGLEARYTYPELLMGGIELGVTF